MNGPVVTDADDVFIGAGKMRLFKSLFQGGLGGLGGLGGVGRAWGAKSGRR